MGPRSFFTNATGVLNAQNGSPFYVRGLAMGGADPLAGVDLSMDGGRTWRAAHLGPDQGRYGFRLWEATIPALPPGGYRLWTRAKNRAGAREQRDAVWNPGGYMRDTSPSIAVRIA